jgi:hypothetical protein
MKISGFSGYPFWSYKKDADLPEEIIIQQIVLYGEIKDMIRLTQLFSKEQINRIISRLSESGKKYIKRIHFFQKVIFE